MAENRFDRGLNPIELRKKPPKRNLSWMTGLVAATAMVVFGVFAFVYRAH